MLPTGTVTFLFTDIEGSTRLWETQRAAMQSALARHDALLRQCIEAHGGHVVKSVGDGACAAFVSATDALEASITAQRALNAEPWPDPVRIRVRMALHSGPAELRDGDYFGPTLNRVARLLALGRGGQTLVSAITYDLCRHYLPPGIALKSLGEHNLKDIDRREVVYEVTHERPTPSVPQAKGSNDPPEVNPPSIAVLPFVNMSRDEENEYFADGLSEELLNVLAKVRGLRVASRTSAFYFKGKDVDLPTVAQKLNVATVLEGSVRKSGQRVRITAQLIQVATDSHLWSETYDRELDDIFAVQDDIAQSVVKELRAALMGEKTTTAASADANADVRAAVTGRADNPEAYRLYLQGRFFAERMTRDDLAKSVDFFRQALALDPEFAFGWVGLSRAYWTQAGYGWAPIDEGFEHSRQAALRALELAPDLAEAHVCLGHVRSSHDWDWKGAEAEYQRAMILAPGNADVLRANAVVAGQLGRFDESIELARRAVGLDPLSTTSHRNLIVRCWFAEQLDEAASAAQSALDLNPRAGLVNAFLSCIRLKQARRDEALALAEREVLPDFRLWAIAMAQHDLGYTAEAEAALNDLIAKHGNEAAYQIAQIFGSRGDVDRGFEWLERAYRQRDPGLSNTGQDPFFRSLHADPRWLPFLRKMGLAQVQARS